MVPPLRRAVRLSFMRRQWCRIAAESPAQRARKALAKPGSRDVPRRYPQRPWPAARILLVEDERLDRRAVRTLLGARGLRRPWSPRRRPLRSRRFEREQPGPRAARPDACPTATGATSAASCAARSRRADHHAHRARDRDRPRRRPRAGRRRLRRQAVQRRRGRSRGSAPCCGARGRGQRRARGRARRGRRPATSTPPRAACRSTARELDADAARSSTCWPSWRATPARSSRART